MNLKCFVCHRRLLACAVPNLQIGPKCARDRGLLPEREPRQQVTTPTRTGRATRHDTQVDWINLINAGLLAGESRP